MSSKQTNSKLITPNFIKVMVATFSYFLAIGALMPVLPIYIDGPLDGTDVGVGLAVGAFSISALIMRPFAGRLGDRRGRRILMISGGGLVALVTLLYGVVETVPALVGLRLLTGVGEALFFVGATAAAVDMSPNERRGEALSFFSLALWAAVGLGPVVGETVLASGRFLSVWVVAAGLSFAAGLIGALVNEVLPAGQAPEKHPLIHKGAVRPGLILLASVWGLAGFTAFIPLYASEIGLAGSATIFVVYGAIMVSIRGFGARIPDRLGAIRAVSAALVLSAVGLVAMGLIQTAAGLFLGVAIFAVGQALAFPSIVMMAMAGTAANERGAVLGTVTGALDLAFGLGGLSLGVVAQLVGYPAVFIVSAGVAAIGLLLLPATARASGSRASDANSPIKTSRSV